MDRTEYWGDLLAVNESAAPGLDRALLRRAYLTRQVDRGCARSLWSRGKLKVHSKTRHLAPNVDLRRIAACDCAGFSGADLSNVLNDAALCDRASTRCEITQGGYGAEAIEKVIAWSLSEKSRRL